MIALFDKWIDKIVMGPVGDWCLRHPCPKWIAPILSALSIVISISAMVLATKAR